MLTQSIGKEMGTRRSRFDRGEGMGVSEKSKCRSPRGEMHPMLFLSGGDWGNGLVFKG